MKKTFILMLFAASVAHAQPKFASEINLMATKTEVIPGYFQWTTSRIGHSKFAITSLCIAESIDGAFSGKAALGPAYKRQTWSAGIMVGAEHTPATKIAAIASPWFHWRSREGKWTFLAVGLFSTYEAGGIMEFWHCSELGHSCELQFGMLNHGLNIGPSAKYVRKGFYCFAGPTIPYLENKEAVTHGGSTVADKDPAVWFPKPTWETIGLHIGIGFERF